VGSDAPKVDKVRVFYNHPEFIAANASRLRDALDRFTALGRDVIEVVFTAHSIPVAMARNCRYEDQLQETCNLVARATGVNPRKWALVYQSRSGWPEDPWLEPDVLDHLKALKDRGARGVLIHPIGFLSDHVEVLYDLDHEAQLLCNTLGVSMIRSQTVGTHPRFVGLLCELIGERVGSNFTPRGRAVGHDGPSHDVCPDTCCLPPAHAPATHAPGPRRQ
jgi:ferrochelatase